MRLEEQMNELSFKPRLVPATQTLADNGLVEGEFSFLELSCGLWAYEGASEAQFVSHWTSSKVGMIYIGKQALTIALHNTPSDDTCVAQINYPYFWLDSMIVSNNDDHSLFIHGSMAPKLITPEDPIQTIFTMLTASRPYKKRVSGLDDGHKQISGRCCVYKVRLPNHGALQKLRLYLQRNSATSSVSEWPISTKLPAVPFTTAMETLENLLSEFGTQPSLHFSIRFQLLKFAYNGKLWPEKVVQLLPVIQKLANVYRTHQCVAALRRLYVDLPYP